MRYRHSKEQSAEFLRMALPLMAAQKAAVHPTSYTIWYEHVASLNPSLSAVLASRIAAQQPLGEEEVDELYARYILTTESPLLKQLHQELHALLEDTTQALLGMQGNAGHYARTLNQARRQLLDEFSLEGLRGLVAELLTETTRIQNSAQAVLEQLESRATEIRTLTDQLERSQAEALIDPLTGLKNRRGFERALLELGTMEGGALLLADIDRFKHINDTYGHLLGDKILRTLGRLLHENVKHRDIVGRWGGEEFALFLPQTCSSGARALAEQIRIAANALQIRKADGTELTGQVTLSIGLAEALKGEGFDTLMQRADAALYQAKRDGRNRVCAAT